MLYSLITARKSGSAAGHWFGPSHEEFHVNGHFHCEIIFSSPCFGSMV
ncbi:hypothetical protein SXCC_02485 [Gluconacetobacter sp. SXCC-1]|nr:hypothetical protein SXCC_02485 [Gluconacetobacter sp. SXCC-1]